jgi:succinyl-CoA synthetase beta subunit
VKSQIHAGGRGKGKFKELGPDAKGGVRLAKSIDDVKASAKEMLGNTLVTEQTGPAGKQVNRLYIEDGADIASEFYLSLLVDRETGAGCLRRLHRRRHGHRGPSPTTRPRRSSPSRIDPATGVMAAPRPRSPRRWA